MLDSKYIGEIPGSGRPTHVTISWVQQIGSN